MTLTRAQIKRRIAKLTAYILINGSEQTSQALLSFYLSCLEYCPVEVDDDLMKHADCGVDPDCKLAGRLEGHGNSILPRIRAHDQERS